MSPYGTVGLNNHFFPSLPPPEVGVGSDILMSPYVTFTAAHTLIYNGENAENSISFIGAIPNGTGGTNGSGAFNTFNGSFVSADLRYSDGYVSNGYKNDYGVIRQEEPFMYRFYSDFRRENNYPRTVNVVGYPRDLVGMHKGTASASKDDGTTTCGNNLGVIHYPMNTSVGMSGGPIFNADNTFTTGIHNFHCTSSSGVKYGNGIPFNEQNLSEILTWLWAPTGKMKIHYPEPNIDINLVAIQSFDANFSAFNLMNIHGDIEERNDNFNPSIRWESSINGTIGNGGVVSSDILKSKLTSGTHRITAIIDSNGESGEKNVNIRITRPVGRFTSPNRCIKNIANPSTCTFNLSWNVTDTPETSVVLNDTANNDFATGNSGSQSFTATSSNTRFKLYPSNQKKILLDTLNTNSLSIKTPTGNLNRTVAVCSLHPSPINPRTLQLRDPKITPNGCGTKLTWSNVKWAVPSIYYRLIGSGRWQHLYTIPCQLNGTLCSGEVDTDQILPELIPVAGAQFKLMQFNSASSGQLSAPFSVTAHRFADVYEYDGGDVSDFNGMGVGIPNSMVINNTLTTAASLGVAQHNHSFHSPAVYDSRVDIDTTQVQVAQTPGAAGFTEGKRLSVTVFNMSNGLNVDIQLQCAGIVTGGIFDGQTGIFDFDSDPTSPIVTDPRTGAKTMEFVITGQTNQIGSLINCLYNRVIIKRIAGTPSENLRYSVVINDPATTTTPVVNTASSVCNHNYCILLLGNNFSTSASVQVREDINGSATLATFSGNDIYNRTSFNGQDRLQWPIQNLSMQNKFRTNGLCFKVISSGLASNEKCFKRPATAAQGLFMGKSIASYLPNNQDIEHTSYVVVGSGGSKLKLMGNSWKKIAYNYNVTPNTILEFSFRSVHQQAEINGIGFIKNGQTQISGSTTWQVYGTQSFANQSYHNYSGTEWVTYRIPIGESFTGSVSHMVFIGDDDNNAGQDVAYKTPVLFEDVKPPIKGFSYDSLKGGHGIHISKSVGNSYLMYFYSYDSNNQPEWFYSLAHFNNNRLSGDLNKVSYNHSNNTNSQVIVGNFTIDYATSAVNGNNNCNGVNRDFKPGAFSWNINGELGQWCLQPSFVSNNAPEVPNTHSGVWYEPASSGWGLSLQTRRVGNNYNSFAVVFYYDANGDARWSSGFDATATVNSYNYNMLHTTGYPRNTSGTLLYQSVGTTSLSLGLSKRATVNLTYPISPNGNWNRANVPISKLTN